MIWCNNLGDRPFNCLLAVLRRMAVNDLETLVNINVVGVIENFGTRRSNFNALEMYTINCKVCKSRFSTKDYSDYPILI